MRINMGGSGSTSDTKTYDAESLIAAANAQAKHYKTLRNQFHTLRAAFNQIAGLGSDFQGHGADAIKDFYAAQVNVVDAWLRLIDKQIAYYRGVAGSIDDKNLGGNTQVQVPFLDDDLSVGYIRSKEMIANQREDISKTLDSISDLVPIDVFSTQDVDHALDASEEKRTKMVLDVQDLDQSLTNEYRQVTEDLPSIKALYEELINSTRQGVDVQPMHFNTEAYHHSNIYQVQDEMEQNTLNYLHEKQKQEQAREVNEQQEQTKKIYKDAPDGIRSLYKLFSFGMQVGIGIDIASRRFINDNVDGINELRHHPIKSAIAIYSAVTNYKQTAKLIKKAIESSFNRYVIHGNTVTRAMWITYATETVASFFIGTKGIDKADKTVEVSSGMKSAAKVKAIETAKRLKKIKEASLKEPILAYAGGSRIPFNTIDTSNLKNHLMKITDGTEENSFINRINNARNLIQQASVKKVNSLSKGIGKNITFKAGYDTHLFKVQDIVRKKNKGIVGGHNLDNFEKAFRDRGWDLEDCIISKKAHPSVLGVYEVQYRLPALDREGNIIAGQYKNIPNPKTVYDPKVISNAQMLAWGREAMRNGIIDGREITGYASNGLKFKGYIENGEIINFFPTLK